MELWAAIDLLQGKVVTLAQGDPAKRTVWKEGPLELAKRWESEGAYGLHIVDLDGAFQSGSNREVVEAIIGRAKIPVQVGGGLRTGEHVRSWLNLGVERVVVGTLAQRDESTLKTLLEEYGPEKMVVATDYKDGTIVSSGWKRKEGVSVLDGIKHFEELGVRNILATSVGRDGLAKGPDVATLKRICGSTGMRVLASGGIRNVGDIDRLRLAGAHGAILGRALYEGTIKLTEVRA